MTLQLSIPQKEARRVIVREILASSGHACSPEPVTQLDNPAATEAAMGPTYPRASICPLSWPTAGGLTGCTP